MGRKSPYNGVKLKVKKIPIDLEKFVTEISIAYGYSDDKKVFIEKINNRGHSACVNEHDFRKVEYTHECRNCGLLIIK